MVVKKHEVNLCVNKVIHVKRLAQCQAHSKDSMLGIIHWYNRCPEYILKSYKTVFHFYKNNQNYICFMHRKKKIWIGKIVKGGRVSGPCVEGLSFINTAYLSELL